MVWVESNIYFMAVCLEKKVWLFISLQGRLSFSHQLYKKSLVGFHSTEVCRSCLQKPPYSQWSTGIHLTTCFRSCWETVPTWNSVQALVHRRESIVQRHSFWWFRLTQDKAHSNEWLQWSSDTPQRILFSARFGWDVGSMCFKIQSVENLQCQLKERPPNLEIRSKEILLVSLLALQLFLRSGVWEYLKAKEDSEET